MAAATPNSDLPPVAIGRELLAGVAAATALTGVVVCYVWINRVSEAVMSIGGSCASGGPYTIARPCPEGTWMMPVGILGGLLLIGAYIVFAVKGGPNWAVFAWPALFGSLGVQFLRAATDSGSAGFWTCGIMFVLMGFGPLVVAVVSSPRFALRALFGNPAVYTARRPTATATGARSSRFTADELTRFAAAARRAQKSAATLSPVGRPATVVAAAKAPPTASTAVVSGLERLAALHKAGDLTETEFERAKHRLLEGES